MRFGRAAALDTRGRGKVTVMIVPAATLLGAIGTYIILAQGGSRGCASDRLHPEAAVTFAGDMYGDPGGDNDVVADGGPWSSLEEYVSDLGEEWKHDPNHNATHTYHIAHNVMTHREEVIYIVDENSDSEVNMPGTLALAWGKDRPSGTATLRQQNASAEANPLRTCVCSCAAASPCLSPVSTGPICAVVASLQQRPQDVRVSHTPVASCRCEDYASWTATRSLSVRANTLTGSSLRHPVSVSRMLCSNTAFGFPSPPIRILFPRAH
jgi:hypothetical protein